MLVIKMFSDYGVNLDKKNGICKSLSNKRDVL